MFKIKRKAYVIDVFRIVRKYSFIRGAYYRLVFRERDSGRVFTREVPENCVYVLDGASVIYKKSLGFIGLGLELAVDRDIISSCFVDKNIFGFLKGGF